jgi:hypothetical protein
MIQGNDKASNFMSFFQNRINVKRLFLYRQMSQIAETKINSYHFV